MSIKKEAVHKEHYLLAMSTIWLLGFLYNYYTVKF